MSSVFLGVASMLYAFDITKRRDANGEEIVPEVDFHGFIRCVPRSYVVRCALRVVRRATGAASRCGLACCEPGFFKPDAIVKASSINLGRFANAKWVACRSRSRSPAELSYI